MNSNQKGMRVDNGSASGKNTQTTNSYKATKSKHSKNKKNLLIYAHSMSAQTHKLRWKNNQ